MLFFRLAHPAFPPGWVSIRWEKLPAWLRDYINIPFPVLSGVVVYAPGTQRGEMVSYEFKDSLGIVIKSCLTKSTTTSSRSHSLSLELSQQEPGNREHPPREQDKAEEERKLPADPDTCPPVLCCCSMGLLPSPPLSCPSLQNRPTKRC